MQRLKLATVLAVGFFATGSALAASQIVPGFDNGTLSNGPLNLPDDGSFRVEDIGFTVDFLGQGPYGGLYINNNGNVTFGNELGSIVLSLEETSSAIIAPFFFRRVDQFDHLRHRNL